VVAIPNFNFTIDENDLNGSLHRLMNYMKVFTSSLDENNVKYLAWGDSQADNVDATHKLKLKFYIPDGMVTMQKMVVNFTLEAFRTYSNTASSGGGQTSGTSSAASTEQIGGDQDTSYTTVWDLGVQHQHMVSDHVHGISHTHAVSDHTHDLSFGIYESTSATGVKVYVDGTLRLDNGGSGYTTDQANLDITQWITTTGWHYVEFSSTQLGRINAAYFVQLMAGADGI